MSSDFRDFVNSSSFNDEEKAKMQKDAKDLVNKYANMTQDELRYNLMKEVANQKANGTFDKGKLSFMLDSIKHLLPEQAYIQIKQALEVL